MEATWFSFC